MPRKARLDFPGALHHVMARGIEKRKIFQNDIDKQNFMDRLCVALNATDVKLYSWCIMPNHVHLLLQTGEIGLSSIMQKVLTGFAMSYNKRYKRVGHLFQNRYKSILCDRDVYLLRLIRYIHLNPVKAGLIKIHDLDAFNWTSHKDILNSDDTESQIEADEILSHFGKSRRIAQKHYTKFIYEGVDDKEMLGGGGLANSLGKNLSMINKSEIDTFDDRVIPLQSCYLGNSEWESWIPTANGLAPMKMVDVVDACYFSKKPAIKSDVYIGFISHTNKKI